MKCLQRNVCIPQLCCSCNDKCKEQAPQESGLFLFVTLQQFAIKVVDESYLTRAVYPYNYSAKT